MYCSDVPGRTILARLGSGLGVCRRDTVLGVPSFATTERPIRLSARPLIALICLLGICELSVKEGFLGVPSQDGHLRCVHDDRGFNTMCQAPPHSECVVPRALSRLLRSGFALHANTIHEGSLGSGVEGRHHNALDHSVLEYSVDLADGVSQFTCERLASLCSPGHCWRALAIPQHFDSWPFFYMGCCF